MIQWNILWELTKTDFKLKYAGTMMGFVWSLLKPLTMLGVLYVVFTFFFQNNVDSYGLFLLLGIMIWNYFVESTSNSMEGIKNNTQMLTKTTLSPSIVVTSACIHTLITFLLNIVAFLIIFFVSGKALGWSALFFIPLTAILFIITTAISHALIIFSSKYTDFKHIWYIIIQIGFWITPIIYSVSRVPEGFQRFLWINPLAQLIEHARNIVIYNNLLTGWQVVVLLVTTILISLISLAIYKSNKTKVVDSL